MSELAALTNAGNSAVLPGFILSYPRNTEIGMAEKEFARRYLEIINGGAVGLPPKLAETIVIDAKNDILMGKFSWGGPIFNLWALARSSVPFMTWLCLRVKHPQVTLEQVMGWYAGTPIDQAGTVADVDAIASATWQLFGFGDTLKKNVGEDIPSPPTGTGSTPDVSDQPPKDSASPPNNSTT